MSFSPVYILKQMTFPKFPPPSQPWNSTTATMVRARPRPNPQSIPLRHRIKRLGRYFFLRFIRLKGSAESVARGLAVGAFAGMFPFFGGQTVIGIILAVLVRGNKMAAVAATWISNPLTYIPLYALNYYIGRRLLNVDPVIINQQNVGDIGIIMEHGREFAAALLLGSCVTGILMGLVAYFIGYTLSYKLKHYYRDRYRRNRKRWAREHWSNH